MDLLPGTEVSTRGLRWEELCLAAFDELKAEGLEAFTRRHDPYWDIPLNEALPQPVIDLPIPTATQPAAAQGTLFALAPPAPMAARRGGPRRRS